MTYFSSRNKVSTVNSSTTPLNASITFTGTAEDALFYESIVVACKTDQAGTLYVDFSPEGTNWDSTLSFAVAAATNEVHRLTVTRRYYRVRFTNTSVSNQTYFRLQTTLGSYKTLTSSLNSTLQTDADALVTRSVLTGETDGGTYRNVPVTPEGHLEVAIHAPRLPFGSIHTESLTPVFQSDAVYGLNAGQENYSSSLSGSATASDSVFIVKTGTTIYAQAEIQSRKRLRYRPGQGLVGRFAGRFDTGVNNCYLVAGFGHAEDGVFFGYKNTEFGILYSNRGKREIQTLTITVGSSTAESITVTLAGTAYTVAVTNSGSTLRTAYEISRGTYAGWEAYSIDSTVIFLANSAGNKTGTFSITASTAVGTFAETQAGAAANELFIPQSSWNGDRLDGSAANNPSGYVADWTKGQVFQIGIQYLGFGSINFEVETTSSDNNPEFTTVHVLKLPNTLSVTSFGNPAYPFTMAAYSAGSTTDLGVYIGSFGGFIEGPKILHGNRFNYQNTIATAGAANYQALFTVMNKRVYGGRANQSVINLINLGVAYKHNQPGTFFIIRNGTLGGNPNFTSYSTNSCSAVDTAATTVSITANEQIVYAVPLSETGHLAIDLAQVEDVGELTIQPGEWISICCRTFSGTATFASASLNTREDQ